MIEARGIVLDDSKGDRYLDWQVLERSIHLGKRSDDTIIVMCSLPFSAMYV